MSGAIPWSVKGIDPKAREAAREAARKHGLTLGEWLNQAILAQEEAARLVGDLSESSPFSGPDLDADASDWTMSGGETARMEEALERLAERLDAHERRQSLVATGLDRTVLGLAARVEDAEAGVRKSSAQVSGAIDEIRRTGEQLVERVTTVESRARGAVDEVSAKLNDLGGFRASVTERLSRAETVGRAAAETALAEVRAAQTALSQQIAEAERRAGATALTAVDQLRHDQHRIESRLSAMETAGRGAVDEALREMKLIQASMQDRMRETEADARRAAVDALDDFRRTHATLTERLAALEFRMDDGAGLTQIESTQQALSDRIDALQAATMQAANLASGEIADNHRAIESRIDKIEQATRETASNLRMGAAAAINQVRAAQVDLEKRFKELEGATAFGDGPEAGTFRDAHAALEQRLDKLERGAGGQERAALHMLDAKITSLAATVREGRDRTASDIETLRDQIGADAGARMASIEQSVEDAVARLTARLEQAETVADTALRQIEAAPGAAGETEALRAMVEERLDTMASSMTAVVDSLRAEFAEKTAAADGGHSAQEVDEALADVNRRLAAAERRQAQTIEAISIEIRRVTEAVDRRLRGIESRNDAPHGAAVAHEEIAAMSARLEERLAAIENREFASAERMGAEIGRIAERLDDRIGTVERRSAEAIELIGAQMGAFNERFAGKQDGAAREIAEQIVASEERQAARLSESMAAVANRIAQVEERAVGAVTPVQKAMASMAARLQAIEDGGHIAPFVTHAPDPAQTPDDEYDFGGDVETAVQFDDIKRVVEEIRATPPVSPQPAHPATDTEANEYDFGATTANHDAEEHVAPRQEIPAFADALEPAPAPAKDVAEAEPGDLEFSWDEVESDPKATAPAEAPPTLHRDAAATAEPAKPAKNDYLANARRAAQASAQQRSRGGAKEPRPAKAPRDTAAETDAKPVLGLRGPKRIVLWGTAGALAVALAGGAYMIKSRADGAADSNARPAPPKAAPQPVAVQPAAEAVAEDLEATMAPSLEEEPASSIADAAKRAKEERERAKATDRQPQASVQDPRVQQASLQSIGRGGVSLDMAAQRGDAVAQYELGLARLSGGQTQEGVSLLRRAANQGLAMAQYRLAKLYERGEGVPVDFIQARQWTERAAAAGNRKAMHDLGVYYARGEGAPLDEATAFRWFRQAAELGVADSQFNLGVLYQQGRGTNANAAEALYWFSIAARAGDNDARARAATLEAQMQPDQIQTIRARATTFAPRPAGARANGEFGQRVWSMDNAQAGAGAPRS